MIRKIQDLNAFVRTRLGRRRPLRTPSASALLHKQVVHLISLRQALNTGPTLWRLVCSCPLSDFDSIGRCACLALDEYDYYDGLDYALRAKENVKSISDEIGCGNLEDPSRKTLFVGLERNDKDFVVWPSRKAGREYDFTGEELRLPRSREMELGSVIAQAFKLSS